jgi:hypothetical protein
MIINQKLLTTLLAVALCATTVSGFARADVDKAQANANADPKAYELLKNAYESRQTLPVDFPGFDAQLVYQEAGKTATGVIRFRSDGTSAVEISGLPEEDAKWLKRQAISFVIHRGSSDFNEAEGKFPLRFSPSADTDFGTLVEYDDPQKLSSRVRNNRSLELTRTDGGKRFLISVLENMECDPGKFIPTRYVVSYFEPQTRVLQMVNIFENRYQKVDGLWLPSARKVITVDHVIGDGLRARSFQFKDIKLVAKTQ